MDLTHALGYRLVQGSPSSKHRYNGNTGAHAGDSANAEALVE